MAVLSGCLEGLPDGLPRGPEGHFTVLMESVYDASVRPESRQRPQDRGVDLPAGSPAADLEIWLQWIRGGPTYDGNSWDHDPPCPSEDTFHGPSADCSRFDSKEGYILPSPRDAERYPAIRYPFDGQGRAVFFTPQPLDLLFRVSDDYTEEMHAQAADPDRCSRWPRAASVSGGSGYRSEGLEVHGSAQRTSSNSFLVTGDVRFVIHWFGVCPDEAVS